MKHGQNEPPKMVRWLGSPCAPVDLYEVVSISDGSFYVKRARMNWPSLTWSTHEFETPRICYVLVSGMASAQCAAPLVHVGDLIQAIRVQGQLMYVGQMTSTKITAGY
jgi:hypothetical protein